MFKKIRQLSSVHENDTGKFRTKNREVSRRVSFVSTESALGSPSSSDCSKAFSTTSTFIDIRCFTH